MYPYTGNEPQHPHGNFSNQTFAPQHGVWSFDSNSLSGAQFRIYTETYGIPEVLFRIYNSGARDEMVVNARLKWLPGPQEQFKQCRTGTLAQHMATIAEEMAILGLPPLQAQDVPTYPLSNGNKRLLAFRQGNRFEGVDIIPHQPQKFLKSPVETGRSQDGLRTFPDSSVPSEPRHEAPEQHTPSHGPIGSIQARDPAASPITHAVALQVEPQSRAATPIPQPVKPTEIDASTTPIASYEALQRQHERRQSRTPVARQQTFQPAQARLSTAPDVSLETQHQDRTDSGSPKIAITRPTPSFVASPTFPPAVPQERSPMPETRPQKVQNGTTAPVLSTKTREDPGGSAMSTPLQPPGSCAIARQWIEAQQDVTPPPLPEGGQELRASEGAGTGLSIEAGLTSTPSAIPDTLGNGASAPNNPEARDPVAHATSPQTIDSKPDTKNHDVVYTCDACKKLAMHYDMVQCDRCASVQYCSHACKRGQRMFHVPHCIGRNHLQSSLQPETMGEDPLLSGEVDLSADAPDLTEEFPCFTCEGTKEHQPDCFIVEFRSGPRPEYTSAMLAELADQAKYFDPEQWREHQNPVEPDPEPYEEVLAQSNEIIKKEESYLNDPFLQVVPDRVLPLMWALRTAPNIEMKFMNENGEIYEPDHPVWADHVDEE